MLWAPVSVWKVFQLVRTIFEKFGAGPITWGKSNRPCVVDGLTAWGRRSNRHGQSEKFESAVFARCCIPVLHCCMCSEGVCFVSGGACICAGGALCGVQTLVWWFALFG
jgi:hypothetical protein